MRTLLIAATAAFLMIPPAFAQTSENLLEQPEQVAPAITEPASVAAPQAKMEKKAQKKVLKATKKMAHKSHKTPKKVMKKTAKKTCAKAAAPQYHYVHKPKGAKVESIIKERYWPIEQVETADSVDTGNVVQAGGAGAALYSSSGSLVTFGQ